MDNINPKHKDRLFSFIFGRDENKKWSLDLYNAVNNTAYINPDDVQIFSLKNAVYMGMKNDIALIIDDVLSVYEQQSTFNPNMPLRELIYTSKLYSKYIKKNKLNIYSESIIQLPIPKLVVFYNGTKNKEDTVLRLSDSFLTNSSVEPDISVNVKMININYGKNAEFLGKCKILEEYSWFIERIRVLSDTLDVSDAVNTALKEMPNDFALKQFLLIHKAEVTDMCITEYDEAETLKAIGNERFAEGKLEGKAEGQAERDAAYKAQLSKMVNAGIVSEEAAQQLLDSVNPQTKQ